MTEIILTSSTLILFLIIIRKMLRGKISPSVQYALWLLVAARLLIPGTLFTAPVSLLDSAESLLTCIEDTFLPESETLHTSSPHTPTFPDAAPPDAAIDYGNTVVTDYPPQSTVPVAAERVNWTETIWKSGTFVAGTVFLLSNFSFYVNLRKKRRLISASELPHSCPVGVYQVPGLTSPCLFGLARPAIYLNEEALNSGNLEHILIHEETHYRHGDHIWAALRCVCLAIHWYNPLVWWAAVLSRRDCELSCDAGAIHRLGEANRIRYGETLLRMVVPGRHPADLLRTATTMSGSKKAMMERITLIAKQPKMLKITLTAVVLMTCGAAVFFFGGAAEEPAEDYTTEEKQVVQAILDAQNNMEPLPITIEYMDKQDLEELIREHIKTQLIRVKEYRLSQCEVLELELQPYVFPESPAHGDTFTVTYSATIGGAVSGVSDNVTAVIRDHQMPIIFYRELTSTQRSISRLVGGELVSCLQIPDMALTASELKSPVLEYQIRSAILENLYQHKLYDLSYCNVTELTIDEFDSSGLLPGDNVTVAFTATVGGIVPEYDDVRTRYAEAGSSFTVTIVSDSSNQTYTEQMRANALSILEQYESGAPIVGWLPTLAYFDWRAMYDTRDKWPEGSDRCMDILAAIAAFAVSEEPITAAQMQHILSATEGLDGAYAEQYQALVFDLSLKAPGAFAYVTWEVLSGIYQARILDYWRFEEVARGIWETPWSRYEAYQIVEGAFYNAISATPAEMLFDHPGQQEQFLLVNAYGISAATYTSSNPNVATVDDSGVVTAVNPGSATITLHYEGAAGQKELTCAVSCEWEDPFSNTTLYTHPSAFFSLTLPSENCEIIESTTGITITLDNESWVLCLLTQPSQWLEEHPSQAMVLGTFDTNGTIQTYLLETEDTDAPAAQRIAASFQLHVTADMISQLVHEHLESDPAQAIPYLPYLSWLNYREQYGEYGEDGLLNLLGTLRDTADSGSLSWAQYHDLLSVLPDSAIYGTFAGMYRDILQTLHDRHPQQFASVLLSEFISPAEQKNTLAWLGLDLPTLEAEALG